MQSHDYVLKVSGWKLDKVTGEFEINSAKSSVGGLTGQPQIITVTAGEWAARDLPKSAFAYYAFIGSEITKVPAAYRTSAEISTFDESYEPGFVDIRVVLTYKRPETAEEVAARIKSSRSPSHSIKFDGGTLIVSFDEAPRIVLDSLDQTDEKPESPFAVEGDQVFLHKTFIEAAAFEPVWGVRTSTSTAGQTFACGFGLGYACEGGCTRTPADKAEKAEVKIGCTVDVSKALDQISKVLSTTELAQSLESVTAKIEHEVTARANADTQLSARIGALEGRISASGSNITQQGAAITPLK